MSRAVTTREDQGRAARLRRKAKTTPLTDIERGFLARHDAAVRRERATRRKPPPAVPVDRLVDAVAARYRIRPAELSARGRGGTSAQAARSVLVVALRRSGASNEFLSKLLRRTFSAISQIERRSSCRPNLDAEVAAVMDAVKIPGAGDVITIQVVVGSRLWHAIDGWEEAFELTDGAIGRRQVGEVSARRAGAE
jgi:hypothetical protein